MWSNFINFIPLQNKPTCVIKLHSPPKQTDMCDQTSLTSFPSKTNRHVWSNFMNFIPLENKPTRVIKLHELHSPRKQSDTCYQTSLSPVPSKTKRHARSTSLTPVPSKTKRHAWSNFIDPSPLQNKATWVTKSESDFYSWIDKLCFTLAWPSQLINQSVREG